MSLALKIFQVTGFKNSGKTTLMCRLLFELKKRSYKVAALKHHGHGGRLRTDMDDTDSAKHFRSGASLVAVSGSMQTIFDYQNEPPLEAFIAFYQTLQLDFLLIEGYKQAPYPKAVLLRSNEDWETLQALKNIRVIVASEGMAVPNPTAPVFANDNVEGLTTFILNGLEEVW